MTEFASTAVTFMVLVVLSSCKATSPTPPTSAPATNTQAAPTPTAEEVFHLRSECARLAEKMLESKNNVIGSESIWSQSSHYNPQTNRCYVEIASQTANENDPYFQASDDLYDGQTGEHLARFISQGKNCPAEPCRTTGTVDDVHHQRIAGFNYAQDAEEYIYDMMYDPRDR
jgi:uncharacterized protein YfcZ (UPF0381/DUF406 family)